VLGAAVLWSTAGVAIKLSCLSGWQISFGRSLIAALLIPTLVPSSRVRPTIKILAVSLTYAGTVTLFALANKLTTAANSIFLQDTAPLYVGLLSFLVLGERVGRGELLSFPLFFLGLALFFCDRLSEGQRMGNLLALTSGVSFALCILGLRGLGTANAAPLVWGNVMAALLSLPGALHGPVPRLVDLGIVAYLGVFQLGIAYVLFARGVQSTPAVEASLLALLEPVLNPIWTFLWAGERPGHWAIWGGSLILVATAWRALAPWTSVLGTRRSAAETSESGVG
jgi:drug/metabolite transporter (DMT)-like permease